MGFYFFLAFTLMGAASAVTYDGMYVYGSDTKPSLANGSTYLLSGAKQNDHYCLTVHEYNQQDNGIVWMWECQPSRQANQEWILRRFKDTDQYHIVSKSSGKCLSSGMNLDGSSANDLQVYQFQCEDEAYLNQLWKVEFYTKYSQGMTYYDHVEFYIPYITGNGGKCLSFHWGQQGKPYIYDCNETYDNQWFRFVSP